MGEIIDGRAVLGANDGAVIDVLREVRARNAARKAAQQKQNAQPVATDRAMPA